MSRKSVSSISRTSSGVTNLRPSVLFVNDLWGYGTVTMARAVADELEGEAERVFAGDGPGFELARRATSFDRLLQVDTMADPVADELDRAMSACQTVISVMNERVARRAAERGIPCLYVDSLLWMWAVPPEVPSTVPYLQEDFPGSARRLEEWRSHLYQGEIVGPLVAVPPASRPSVPDVVLVNFGGLSCSLVDDESLLAYADVMIRCVATALDRWGGRVVVAAGKHVLDGLDASARSSRAGIELVDLDHDSYLGELRRSHALISSAGMHAIYEACAWEVPCVYLPAQNMSQALALGILERKGFARPRDWSHIYELEELDPTDQPASCRLIAEQIHRFRDDPDAQAGLVAYLRRSLDDRGLAAALRRQARFYRTLGARGAPRVKARVLELLKAPAPAPA